MPKQKYKELKTAILVLVVIAIIIFGASILVSTMQKTTNPVEKNAQTINSCINLCKAQLAMGKNLSEGPCLSNNISIGWVCDVAHFKRTKADNNIKNQCSEYVNGIARHFVEVNPECDLIKYN